MKTQVGRVGRKGNQHFRAIVVGISDMMYFFFTRQKSSNLFFNDKAVLEDFSSGICKRVIGLINQNVWKRVLFSFPVVIFTPNMVASMSSAYIFTVFNRKFHPAASLADILSMFRSHYFHNTILNDRLSRCR